MSKQKLLSSAKDALFEARAALLARFDASTDAGERAEIVRAVEDINIRMDKLALEGLLNAALALSESADALERVVASAKLRPLDHTLRRIVESFSKLEAIAGEMHREEGLTVTGDEAASAAPAKAKKGPAKAMAAPAGAGKVATDFESLEAEYRRDFETCVPDKARESNIAYYLKRIETGKASYVDVTAAFGIPWYFVAIIHGMECGFDFGRHLHNGDPLSARTVNVPKGRPGPEAGDPPFSWRASALDAIRLKKLPEVKDWSTARMLHLLEGFNGYGYRRRGIKTPYLWSFSNHYKKGKFVKDGVFDPEAVSQQCGAAVILKAGRLQGRF